MVLVYVGISGISNVVPKLLPWNNIKERMLKSI